MEGRFEKCISAIQILIVQSAPRIQYNVNNKGGDQTPEWEIDMKTANEIAHEIVTEAAAPVIKIRELAVELGLSEKQVSDYVKKLAYRKSYNTRPEVVAARKLRNAERAAVQKAITQRMKNSGRKEELEQLVEMQLAVK